MLKRTAPGNVSTLNPSGQRGELGNAEETDTSGHKHEKVQGNEKTEVLSLRRVYKGTGKTQESGKEKLKYFSVPQGRFFYLIMKESWKP